jgi:putative spermidine/putrescine transport system permease protein
MRPAEVSARRKTNWVPYLLSLPALAFLGILYLLPVVSLVASSFVSAKPDAAGHFTLKVYAGLLSDPYNILMIWRTLKVSFITTVMTLVLAFPVALCLRQVSPRMRLLISFVLLSPLLTSVVVRTLAWVILLAPRGILNEILVALGFGAVKLIYNEIGVIIGLTHVFLGYMVLALMTSVLKIDENLLLAANNLGASNWNVLRKIILPLSLPGILAGSILVFTMCASTYATPRLLGGSSNKVVAMEIYDLAINFLEWKEAAALASILFVVIGLVVWGGTRLMESSKRRAVFE